MDRRKFLQGLLLSLPSATLITNVAGAFGSPPLGVRMGWNELQVFYPGFIRRQKELLWEYGMVIAEERSQNHNDGQEYYDLFEWPDHDPTDGLSVMEAYVKAVHKQSGLEEWTKECTDWCVFPRPIPVPLASGNHTTEWMLDKAYNVWVPDGGIEGKIMVRGVHSWNERGEPGGSNPGPHFHLLVGDKWRSEDDFFISYADSDKAFGSYDNAMDAFYKAA